MLKKSRIYLQVDPEVTLLQVLHSHPHASAPYLGRQILSHSSLVTCLEIIDDFRIPASHPLTVFQHQER